MAHQCVLLSWGVSNNGKAFKLERECRQSRVTWKEEERLKSRLRSKVFATDAHIWLCDLTAYVWSHWESGSIPVCSPEWNNEKSPVVKTSQGIYSEEEGKCSIWGEFLASHIKEYVCLFYKKLPMGENWDVLCPDGWCHCPDPLDTGPLASPTITESCAFLTHFCWVGSGKIVFPSYYIQSNLFQRNGWLVPSLGHEEIFV